MNKEKVETEFTRLYLALKKENPKTNLAFRSLQNMGFKKTQRTMDLHIKKFNATGHALNTVKRNSKKSKLNDDQMNQIDQWIKLQNSNNSPIQLLDIKKQIFTLFKVELCKKTVGNIVKRLNHTQKTCQTKTPGFQKTNDELKTEYWNFIIQMRKENKFYRAPKEIRSIDVTYTKKPAINITTFSSKGGSKQRAKYKVNNYTNAIVTMISGDGINHTPCLLYTHDPKFNPEQKNTARGKRIREELDEALVKYNINKNRIIYKKSDKNYYAESPDVYEDFLNHYDIPKDFLILHDNGNAYKRAKVSIFDSNGFKNHVAYPTDVHQWLSPNDNKLHGCKSTWYQEYYKFENDVSPSLRLMELIDLETVKNSKRYFQNNLFQVKKSDLDEIIGN